MNPEAQIFSQVDLVAWMNIDNPDMSIEDAVKELESIGNKILEIDKKNRRIKVAQMKVELK